MSRALGIVALLLGLLIVAAVVIASVAPEKKSAESGSSAPDHLPPPLTHALVHPVAASKMTKDSGIRGVPKPTDARPLDDNQGFSTSVGSVAALTEFYENWMNAHGWTFEPKHSVMTPDEGRAKSLGFTTSQVWCKRTRPITTVSIIIGSGDNSDRGDYAEIRVLDLKGEDSCP